MEEKIVSRGRFSRERKQRERERESSRSRQGSRDVRWYPCQRFENYRGKTDGRALLIAITNNNFVTAHGRAV